MIELRLLGPLDLRNAEGVELRSVLSQPKRVALLAYLAVQGGGGFHRRDRLLALFWPESDTERARGALRRALYFLRQSLGEGVIVSRGDEEVGIDPARLRCDAAEFVRLLDAGNPAQALELYGGDLLESFFISEAPDFEQWLEEERRWLRGRAAWAAWALAEEAEAAGDLEIAVQLARRAVTLSGEDEPATRKWMALLARSGDPAGALRAYDDLVGRLAGEYELEPAPETQALAEAVRAGGNGADPSASALPIVHPPPTAAPEEVAPEPPPPLADPAPEAAPAESPLAPSDRERWGRAVLHSRRRASSPGAIPALHHRPWLVLLSLLGVALLSGAVLLAHLRSAPAPVPAANVVAVLPFSYYGSGESAYLGEGIVRLLSTNLNGAGELRSVDPRALLNAAGQGGVAPGDPTRARALAERFGAGVVVQGHIIETGGRLRITAVLSSSKSGVSEVTVEGEAGQLFDLVDELTAKLLAVLSPGPGARLTRLAATTTHSLPALRAYLEGESQMHAGRYGDALDSFQRAVAADTSFALAYYRLSNAAHWLNNYHVADPARARARQLRGRLPRREGLLVEAWTLHQEGEPLGAERLYRSAVTEYPDDVEAWFELGEVLFHWGPSVGRSVAQAREPFERVLAFEPQNAGALIHLARIAALQRDTERLVMLVERLQALEPAGDQALEMAALRAFARGDRSEIHQLMPRLAAAGDAVLLRMATTLAVFANDLTAAAELAGRVAAPEREAAWRARGRVLVTQLEMARGRWRAAQAHLARFERFTEQQQFLSGPEYRAVLAVLPFLPLPPGELEAIRDEVSRLPRIPSIEDDSRGWDWPQGIYAAHQHYLRGLLSVRLGDPVAALGEAMQLEAFAGSVSDTAMSRRLARGLRAEVARIGGQPHDALRLLPEPGVWPDAILPRLENYGKEHERFLYAELLRAVGRDEEALRWYATFPDPSGADLIYLAPSHLRRAEIHERRGEREQAAEHYRRFLELWRDADPELQPLVRQARGRMAGLGR